MNTPNFIKVKDTSFVFANDGCFKFYVPEKFFDTKLAEPNGEYINLFGMLTYALFDKNDKPIGSLRTFRFPTTFITKPDDIEIMRDVKLTKNSKSQDYRVLKYYKDGVIVVSYDIVQDALNLDKFYKAVQYGNIPNTIDYYELQNYFIRNIQLTGNAYSVSLQLIGVVISELARSLKDSSVPYRLSNTNDHTAYQMANIRDIPQNVSPFTAITSERWDDAVISSITTKNTKESPLERIMMEQQEQNNIENDEEELIHSTKDGWL